MNQWKTYWRKPIVLPEGTKFKPLFVEEFSTRKLHLLNATKQRPVRLTKVMPIASKEKSDIDYKNFNIMILGPSQSGKSSFIRRATTGIYDDYYFQGNEWSEPKIYTVNEKKLEVKFIDASKTLQGRGNNWQQFKRKTTGIIVVYDCNNRNLDDVHGWLGEAARYSTEGVPMLIVCNKVDLLESEHLANDVVLSELGQLEKSLEDPKHQCFTAFQNSNIYYYTVSVKDNARVEDCINLFLKKILSEIERFTAEDPALADVTTKVIIPSDKNGSIKKKKRLTIKRDDCKIS